MGIFSKQKRSFLLAILTVAACLFVTSIAHATVLIEDNFAGTTINTTNWTETDSGGTGGTVGNIQQNEAIITSGGNSTWGTNMLQTANSYSRASADLVADFDILPKINNSSGGVLFGGTTTTQATYFLYCMSGTLRLRTFVAGTQNVSTGFPCVANTVIHARMVIKQSGGADVYINNSPTPNASVTQGTFSGTFSLSLFLGAITFDNFFLTQGPTQPAAPNSLNVRAGDTQVKLDWTAGSMGSSPINDYVIEYKLSSEPSVWTTFNDGVSTQTSATIPGLTNGSSYDFRIRAVNSVGTSSPSQVSTTVPVAPIFSDSFSGTTINKDIWTETDAGGVGGTVGNVQQNGSLSLAGNGTWATNMLTTADTYDRNAGDVIAEGMFTIPRCDANSTISITYGGPDITSDAYFAYYYQGMARLAGFGGSSGNIATGWSCTNNVPFKMTLVVNKTGGARLYINDDLKATLLTGTFTNLPFSLEGFTPIAANIDDFSITNAGVPSIPNNVIATPSDGQVALSWDAAMGNSASVTDYRIDYKIASSATWTTFSDGVSTATSATVTGLASGLSYTFRVYAINSLGHGGASSAVTATPVVSTPTAPYASQVTIQGTASVGLKLVGSYMYIDPNADTEAGTTYRWLSADTQNGTYDAIPGATTTQYVPDQAQYGKYIKFEVTPVSSVDPTSGTPVLSAAVGPVTTTNFLNTIISTGQSLAIGRVSTPALSTTQPYSNVMLSGPGIGETNETGGGGRGTGTSLIPLVEVSQESMGSSMANGITHLVGDNSYQIGVINNAQGGTAYSGLKKGSAPYAESMQQLDNIIAAAYTQGKKVRVLGVTNIHGETDNLNGTTYDQYKAYLEQWQADYQQDVNTKTGSTGIVPMFTDQMSTFSSPYSLGQTTGHIPAAQLDAAEENPGKIYLVTPKYFFSYADQHHLTNTSSRWLGEYYAKVMYKVLINHEAWRPLTPDSSTISGDQILVKFHVPAGKIVFDTTMQPMKANYGFEYYDSSNSATISSVEIVDNNTVKIGLSNIPTGSDKRIRYAYTGEPNAMGGTLGAPRGNLRDTDDAPSQYGNTLYDWAVHFDRPLTVPAPDDGGRGYVSGGGPAPTAAVGTSGCTVTTLFSPTTGAQCPTGVVPTAPSAYTFTRTLSVGMRGADVKELQKYLNTHGTVVALTGAGAPGKETDYFGLATKAAVVKFQELHAADILAPSGLTKGTGLFGPATRRFVNGK